MQGCGDGVGVARSLGNEPGVGAGDDQAASTPIPGRLLQFNWFARAKNSFSVKSSGLSPFSNFPSQYWLNDER